MVYNCLESAGFPGFWSGVTLAFFQLDGILPVENDLCMRKPKKESSSGPKCFRCTDAISSGPIALEFDIFLIASCTSLIETSTSPVATILLAFLLSCLVLRDGSCLQLVTRNRFSLFAAFCGFVTAFPSNFRATLACGDLLPVILPRAFQIFSVVERELSSTNCIHLSDRNFLTSF